MFILQTVVFFIQVGSTIILKWEYQKAFQVMQVVMTITITTYKIVLNRVLYYIIIKLLLLSLIKEPWWSSRKDHWPQHVNTTYVGRSQLGGVQKYVSSQ
jgi:hypothetical protein